MFKRTCNNCDNFYTCRITRTRGNRNPCKLWIGWVPCNEELPKDREFYLCQFSNKVSEEYTVMRGGAIREFWTYWSIEAWRKLPDKYKEGKR